MISVTDAHNKIAACWPHASIDSLSIEDLHSATLRQELRADRDYPPFDRVAMDGIAIAFDAWTAGCRQFPIAGCARAGSPQEVLLKVHQCFEVMTGAPLPQGCDTVIRYEDVQISDGIATLPLDLRTEKQQNIHARGSDYKRGQVLLESGMQMNSPRWAIAASVGAHTVQVSHSPRIAVVSTGDELIDVRSTPLDHQIRRSNSYAILSSLRSAGCKQVVQYQLRDNQKDLLTQLGAILEDFDILVLSGGVSKGKFDFVPQVLSDLKVKREFHKVRQRPGKPLWFGMSENNRPVFGLPGNPVSALVCLHRYLMPLLQPEAQKFAVLTETVKFKKELTYFQSVECSFSRQGVLEARPIASNGSGDFASLIRSSGFIELPEHQTVFEKGSAHPVYLWRGLI